MASRVAGVRHHRRRGLRRALLLERACQVQLYAMWTGGDCARLRPKIVTHTLNQYQTYGRTTATSRPAAHFDALKTILDAANRITSIRG